MKAVFNSFKEGDPYLIDLPIPNIGDNDILIQNKASLISSGTEKYLIEFSKSSLFKKIINNKDRVKQVFNKITNEGLLSTLQKVDNKLNYPFRLGYSSAGKVIAKGKNVTNFKIGDRVVSNSFHSEIVSVSSNLCAHIPKNVSYEEAIFCIPGSIALHSIRISKPTLGENFLVVGLGLIGQLTMQILDSNGCNVVGVDINKKKINIAKKNKLTAFKYSKKIDEYLLKAFNKQSLDGVIFTSTVNRNTINYYANLCRKRSRITIVGNGNTEFSRDLFYKKELSLKVSCSYGPGRYDNKYEMDNLDYPIEYVRWTENRNFTSFLNLLDKKKINTSSLLTHNYLITDIDKAYKKLFDEDVISVGLKYKDLIKKNNILKISTSKIKNFNDKEIKVSFIGAGNYTANTLLPILRSKKSIKLSSIYSVKGVSSTILAKKYSFEKSTTNLHSIMNKKETIFITSTHDSHGKLFIEALKKNLNVYIEKPLAISLKELNDIEKSLKKFKGVSYIGYNRRFSKISSDIYKILIRESDPIFINYNINAPKTNLDHWSSNPKIGGRLVGEICHFIDYCSFMLNSDVISWKCLHQNNLNDNLTICLKYQNGSTANINYVTMGCEQFPKENIFFYFNKKIINIIDFKK